MKNLFLPSRLSQDLKDYAQRSGMDINVVVGKAIAFYLEHMRGSGGYKLKTSIESGIPV